MSSGYIDADGHVMENFEQIKALLEPPFQNPERQSGSLLPSLDQFHTPNNGTVRAPGTFDRSIGPERWLEFMDRTELEYAVLYPTTGLSYGNIAYPRWALAYARAYNNWLHREYLQASPKLQAVALIPMQDPAAAVDELERAVCELGMVGAMLPSNGLGDHISAARYWPIYEKAEALDCVLAVHGGNYNNLGFNSYTVFPAARALGMPFPLAIAMTGLIVDGVLDRFPKLRIGLLEGGTAWVPLVIDRLERELEYGGLEVQRPIVDYFTDGRVFIGCEGNERALATAIERVGPGPFMFASDFPHEISLANCREEMDEILERTDLSDAHKPDILGNNARRFYKLPDRQVD
ncbi:MAG TPA: amidohydrolase family protein [Chloroflexota bacterium]|nr:amidohydrolase family protein [Chloroflexota bacterium]